MPHGTKTTSMKVSKSEAQEQMPKAMDAPKYPYGLRISLQDESIKKLKMKKLPSVGDTLRLYAIVEVSSVSQHDSQEGGERNSLDLQITDLSLMSDEGEPIEKSLYKS